MFAEVRARYGGATFPTFKVLTAWRNLNFDTKRADVGAGSLDILAAEYADAGGAGTGVPLADLAVLEIAPNGLSTLPNTWYVTTGTSGTSVIDDAPFNKVGLAGLVSWLAEAKVYPSAWPSATPPNFQFVNATPGFIMRTLIDRAKADRSELPWLLVDFTGPLTSAGTAWSSTLTRTYDVGTSLLDVLRDLQATGFLSYQMVGRTLQLFNPTENITFWTPNQVTFRRGQLISEQSLNTDPTVLQTHMLVIGDGGVMVEVNDAAALALVGRRRTGTMTASGITDGPTLQLLGQRALAQVNHVASEETLGARDAIVLGDGTRTVQPWVNYQIGDWVWEDVAGTLKNIQVQTIGAAAASAESELAVSIAAGDLLDAQDLKNAKLLAAILGGTTGGLPNDAPVDYTFPSPVAGVTVLASPYPDAQGNGAVQATLAWTAPSTNADGTALTDYAGADTSYQVFTTDPVVGTGVQTANNKALGLGAIAGRVTANFTPTATRSDISTVTDGTVGTVYYGEANTETGTRTQTLTMDLGQQTLITSMLLKHFEGRTYARVLVEGSVDGNTWFTVFDTNQAGTYAEPAAGRAITFSAFGARYLRDSVTYTVTGAIAWVEWGVFGVLPSAVTTPWSPAVRTPSGAVAAYLSSLPSGGLLLARARAVDNSNHASPWVYATPTRLPTYSAVPATPSAPTVTSGLAVARIVWNGLDATGSGYGPTFKYLEVHRGTVSGFTPTTATLVDQLTAAGVSVQSPGAYGTTYYYRLRAVSQQNVASLPSAEASGSVSQVVAADVFDGAIGSAKLADLAVITAKIADLAVNDAKIGNLSVGKLIAGTITADVVLGSRLKTADTGQRVELNSLGLQGFNSAGTLVSQISNAGDNFLTGTFRTAMTGRRVQMLADSSSSYVIDMLTGLGSGAFETRSRIQQFNTPTTAPPSNSAGDGSDGSSASAPIQYTGETWRVLAVGNDSDGFAGTVSAVIRSSGDRLMKAQSAGTLVVSAADTTDIAGTAPLVTNPKGHLYLQSEGGSAFLRSTNVGGNPYVGIRATKDSTFSWTGTGGETAKRRDSYVALGQTIVDVRAGTGTTDGSGTGLVAIAASGPGGVGTFGAQAGLTLGISADDTRITVSQGLVRAYVQHDSSGNPVAGLAFNRGSLSHNFTSQATGTDVYNVQPNNTLFPNARMSIAVPRSAAFSPMLRAVTQGNGTGALNYNDGSAGGSATWEVLAGAGTSVSFAPITASAFTVSSSAEGKEQIADYDGDALAQLRTLRAVTYRRPAPTQPVGLVRGQPTVPQPDPPRQLGLIAEEAPAVLAVATDAGPATALDVYALATLTAAAVQQLADSLDAYRQEHP